MVESLEVEHHLYTTLGVIFLLQFGPPLGFQFLVSPGLVSYSETTCESSFFYCVGIVLFTIFTLSYSYLIIELFCSRLFCILYFITIRH